MGNCQLTPTNIFSVIVYENMSLIKFVKIIQNKSIELEFMCDNFEKKSIRCPHCKSNNHYILSRRILRCMKYEKTIDHFTSHGFMTSELILPNGLY